MNMDEKEIKKDMATTSKGIMQNNDSKYVRLFYMRFPKIQTASGQLNLNLNYFKNEICQPDDNPPVGIVLGARKDELLMEYALQGIDNQLFAARYQLYLPNREELQSQLDNLLNNSY